jgi:citrate lyase gamma subunit
MQTVRLAPLNDTIIVIFLAQRVFRQAGEDVTGIVSPVLGASRLFTRRLLLS